MKLEAVSDAGEGGAGPVPSGGLGLAIVDGCQGGSATRRLDWANRCIHPQETHVLSHPTLLVDGSDEEERIVCGWSGWEDEKAQAGFLKLKVWRALGPILDGAISHACHDVGVFPSRRRLNEQFFLQSLTQQLLPTLLLYWSCYCSLSPELKV